MQLPTRKNALCFQEVLLIIMQLNSSAMLMRVLLKLYWALQLKYKFIQLPIFKDLFIYLKAALQRETGREKEIFQLLGHSPDHSQQLRLSQAEGMSQNFFWVSIWVEGPKHLDILCYFPKHINRNVNDKWSCLYSCRYHMVAGTTGGVFNMLYIKQLM